jgi:hypothetical protein
MILNHLRRNGVSYLALAVALSTGTAYAATQIANGSVTTAKLAKNAVTSPKIKKNAVKSADVKDGSLTAADLAPGSLLAFSSQADGQTPSATPDLPNQLPFAFATAGRTYLQLSVDRLGVSCDNNSGRAGLYLDGAPVPGTGYDAPSSGDPETMIFTATVNASAGNHVASLALDCPGGNPLSSTHEGSNWFVLATK